MNLFQITTLKQYRLLLSLFLSIILVNLLVAQKTVKTRKPNIIVILADDMGYGDAGCYGQQKIATPHIDEMASQGMRFTQFYSESAVCAPARTTLLLGRHTGQLHEAGGKQAIRMNNWKAVRLNVSSVADSHIELYDLSKDIEEKIDIAKQNPGIIAQMEILFKEAHTPDKNWPLLVNESSQFIQAN